MSVAVQYVVRPNPGTDPAKITELAKEGAALWRKHGGKVTYWAVAVGEVGNRVLSITSKTLQHTARLLIRWVRTKKFELGKLRG